VSVRWKDLKGSLLSRGTARLTGLPADKYIARSAAGPGAGGAGSVFFTRDGRRVRLALDPAGNIEVIHRGGGDARILLDGREYSGKLEPVALHCPRQAYITVSGSCIFHCRYCPVPAQAGGRKTVDEIVSMVGAVRNRIDAIAITSGVMSDSAEEEAYVITVVRALIPFGIPIGVSIYPTPLTPRRLHDAGVAEVKFNIEAATPALFADLCPGLDGGLIWHVLEESVALFGRGRVFSNVIVGLSETDAEMESCIRSLTAIGVIPVLRPLSPAAGLKNYRRPAKERLMRLADLHYQLLKEADLDPSCAVSMCSACTGCDLVPGRDFA
jgi:biotin synthase-related radical SAM superfamily protein